MLMPSQMVRSRQIAMVHRAMLHKSATWTIYLQNWLSQWGDPWMEGWDGMLLPPPKTARSTPWVQALSEWRKMEWKAPVPDTPWEARAIPIWGHPALPGSAKSRKSAEGKALAEAGIRRVDDLWCSAQRRWKSNAEIKASHVGLNSRMLRCLEGVRQEVAGWLKEGMDLLLEAPPAPTPQTTWWDYDRGQGGTVLGVSECEHADPGFGGFDVRVAPRRREQWRAAPTTEGRQGGLEEQKEHKLTVCGYNGCPIAEHPQDHPKRAPRMTDLVLQEGVVPSKWYSEGKGVRCCANAGGRRIRRVQQARRWHQGNSPVLKYTEKWAAQFGTTEGDVLHHFTAAGRVAGLPMRAKVLLLKVLWKRVFFKGREGDKHCPLCQTQYLGEAEHHVFFTCVHAKVAWGRAMEFMRAGGVSPRGRTREYMVSSRGKWTSTTLRRVQGPWRQWWACIMWGIWRSYCDWTHDAGQSTTDQQAEVAVAYAVRTLWQSINAQKRMAKWGSSAEMKLTEETELLWQHFKLRRSVDQPRGGGGLVGEIT